MKHIPNILSCLRILMIGAFVWLFTTTKIAAPTNYWWAIIVYVLAFATDVADGYLARTFNWITPLGKLLDPLADKMMTIAALVCILVGKVRIDSNATFYVVLFTLVAVKELLMLIGGLIMLKAKRVAYSDWYGKTAMGIFACGIVLTLLSFPIPEVEVWSIAVLSMALGLSCFAMAHYAKSQMFVSEDQGPKARPEDEALFEKVDRLS